MLATEVINNPPEARQLEQLASLFKALADATRLRILVCLAEQGRMSVRDICDAVGQSQPAVSHHLKQLRDNGLIDFHRDGKFNRYALDPRAMTQVLREFYPASFEEEVRFNYDELDVRFRVV